MQCERNLPVWRETPFRTRGADDGPSLPPPPTYPGSDSNSGFRRYGFLPSETGQWTDWETTWPTNASSISDNTKMATRDKHHSQCHHWPGRVLQPTKPQFQREVGIIYTIIKAAHHFEKLSGNIMPRFIHNLTRSLSKKIHPFMSSISTTQSILENADNWRIGLVFILKNHYNSLIEEQLKLLQDLPANEWNSLFQMAATWAKKSFNSCLLPTVLSTTWTLIKSRFPEVTDRIQLQPPQPSRTRDETTPPGASSWNTPPRTASSPPSRGRQSPPGDSTRGAAPTKAKGIPPTSTRGPRTAATQTDSIQNNRMTTALTQTDLPASRMTTPTRRSRTTATQTDQIKHTMMKTASTQVDFSASKKTTSMQTLSSCFQNRSCATQAGWASAESLLSDSSMSLQQKEDLLRITHSHSCACSNNKQQKGKT